MPGRGLEPLRISPPDPKSGASANSATLASRFSILDFQLLIANRARFQAADLLSAEQTLRSALGCTWVRRPFCRGSRWIHRDAYSVSYRSGRSCFLLCCGFRCGIQFCIHLVGVGRADAMIILVRFGQIFLAQKQIVESFAFTQFELLVHLNRFERANLNADLAAHANGDVDVEDFWVKLRSAHVIGLLVFALDDVDALRRA